jgi:two-component system phosphate regulon response regulator OmpR
MSSTRPYHLYVVEDDHELRHMLCGYLESRGIAVTPVPSAEEMLRGLGQARPDLIVLDVGLPGMSGLQACQRLRADGDRVPVIMLTAHADEVDRVVGLEMGADDYVGKPFSARELLARVHAVLRRVGLAPAMPAGGAAAAATVPIGEFVFHVASRSLHRGSEVRVLNTVEHALLAELTASPGAAISRERLLAVSHTRKEPVMLRAVDAAIMRLRRVVEPEPGAPRFIQTVRGQGYMFVPAGAVQAA